MTVVFPGDRWVTVKIRSRVQTAAMAKAVANAELAAMTPDQIGLLEEVAKPGEPAPDIVHIAAPIETMIAPVFRDPRPHAPVHCPGCGFRLGYADSPTISYRSRCSACERRIAIDVNEGAISVTLYIGDGE